jgi:hypothetical protein
VLPWIPTSASVNSGTYPGRDRATLICSQSFAVHVIENLPQELVNRIIWFPERYPDQGAWCPAIGQSYQEQPSEFPRLVGLDCRWEGAIETITFRHLVINSNGFDSLQWYFTGPQAVEAAHGDESTHSEFRIHPAARTFDPFLAALAKAVAQMPVLESLMLTCELMGDTGRLHICYHAPGRKSDWADERLEDVGRRRIYYACEVGEVWVPEPDAAAGLRRAGVEKFGGEAVERYLGSQYLPRHQRRPV